MNTALSRVKIPQRQERKIGDYVIQQNLVLPRSLFENSFGLQFQEFGCKTLIKIHRTLRVRFHLSSGFSLEFLKFRLQSNFQTDSRDFKLSSFAKASEDLRPELPRLSSAEAEQPSLVASKAVAPPPIPGIRPLPTDAGWPSEAPLAKGLKLGQEKTESLILNPLSLTKKPEPPAIPKPSVNIDQKLEELKKKVSERKNP